MLTSDPIYYKPLIPKITIENEQTGSDYTYNPFSDSGTTNKPIHLSIGLSENSFGTFVLQIEDQNNVINRDLFGKGSRVIVEVGKQASQLTRLMFGLVRKTGHSRGANKKVLYNLFGSSTGIRCNERVVYYSKEGPKLDQDDTTIDNSDASMNADSILYNAFTATNSAVPFAGTQAESSSGIVNVSSLVNDSVVEDKMSSVQIEYGEIMDVINLVEEQTNSEFYVNTNSKANLRYELSGTIDPLSLSGGRGFTIKNVNDPNDDADDTMYLRGKDWNYEESIYKSDSYSSRIFSILPADSFIPSSVADLGWRGSGGTYYNCDTTGSTPPLIEWGMKFRPIHSKHYPGDFMFGLTGTVSDVQEPPSANPETRAIFRIATSAVGATTPESQSVVAWIRFKQQDMFGSGGFSDRIFANEFEFMVGSSVVEFINLDTTKDYWMILADDFAGNAVTPPSISYYYSGWVYTSYRQAQMAKRSTSTGGTASSTSSAGTGWSNYGIVGRPLFEYMPRRAQAFMAYDDKAIRAVNRGSTVQPIETALPSPPATVRTKEAMYQYMVNSLYFMSRPRANFAMNRVTAPNVPLMPGDTLVIDDTILGFSTEGNQFVIGRCGDLQYNWGTFNGQGLTYEAPTNLFINPVVNISRYY